VTLDISPMHAMFYPSKETFVCRTQLCRRPTQLSDLENFHAHVINVLCDAVAKKRLTFALFKSMKKRLMGRFKFVRLSASQGLFPFPRMNNMPQIEVILPQRNRRMTNNNNNIEWENV
jgi:hypothetical protein